MLRAEDQAVMEKLLPFWEKLGTAEAALLKQNARAVHYDKGDALYCGDSECIGVLIVKSGALRVYITSDEGREVTLYRLEQGSVCILSASCVLKTIDFAVDIEAEKDTELLQISSVTFAKITAANVYAELYSYKLATERFSDVMWAMQQLLFTSFDGRLAQFLLEESGRQKSAEISMTQEQIARNLGSAREVVSRMLNYFAREGWVVISRGGVRILDEKGLRQGTDCRPACGVR